MVNLKKSFNILITHCLHSFTSFECNLIQCSVSTFIRKNASSCIHYGYYNDKISYESVTVE